MMGASIRVNKLPADYRWAGPLEVLFWDTLSDAIQVIVGKNDQTDIAIPSAYPVMIGIEESPMGDIVIEDCFSVIGPHTNSHRNCPTEA